MTKRFTSEEADRIIGQSEKLFDKFKKPDDIEYSYITAETSDCSMMRGCCIGDTEIRKVGFEVVYTPYITKEETWRAICTVTWSPSDEKRKRPYKVQSYTYDERGLENTCRAEGVKRYFATPNLAYLYVKTLIAQYKGKYDEK